MSSRRKLLSGALFAAAVAVAAAIGLSSRAADRSTPPRCRYAGDVVLCASPSGAANRLTEGPTVALQLPGEVNQLTYDAGRDALWFAFMQPRTTSWVYRFDIATSKTDRWQLPIGSGSGFLTEVRLASDGAVWVSEDDAVVRLVPESGEVTSAKLDPKVPNIFAMAADGTGALVAQMGVPYLTKVSSDMEVVGKVPLPADFNGARDVTTLPNGSIAVLCGCYQPGRMAILDPAGKQLTITTIAGLTVNSRMVVDSTGAIEVSQTPSTTYTTAGTSSPLLADQAVNLSAVAPDPAGGVVAYDEVAGMLYRIADGHVTKQIPLPATHGTVEHLGKSFEGEAAAAVRAMAVDVRGVTWLIVGRDRTLASVDL